MLFELDVLALCMNVVSQKLGGVHLEKCRCLQEVELRGVKGLKIFQGLALELM